MANLDKGRTVTLQELLVTSLAQTDAVAKLLIVMPPKPSSFLPRLTLYDISPAQSCSGFDKLPL